VIRAEARIHKDPAPMINVSNLNQSSVDFIVRIWCNSSDLLKLRLDINRKVQDALDLKGIEIPFSTTKNYQYKGLIDTQ
jgi:small conductance mechanosensitive channel